MRELIRKLVDTATQMRTNAVADRVGNLADRMLPYVKFYEPVPDVAWDAPESLNFGRGVRFATNRKGVVGAIEFHTDPAGRPECITGQGVREVRFARDKLSPDDLCAISVRTVRTEYAQTLLDALENIRDQNKMPDRVPFRALLGHAEAKLTADGCVVTLPAVAGTLQVDGAFAFNAYGDPVRMQVGKVIDTPLGGRTTPEIEADPALVTFEGPRFETHALAP